MIWGTHCANGSGSWGPTHPKFGMVVGLSSVLDKFVFFSIKHPSSKIRRSEDDRGQNLGQNWDILPPVKRGQFLSNVCGYFMSSAGDTTVSKGSTGVCWTDFHL